MAAYLFASAPQAAASPGLLVIPRPVSGAGSSYFRLRVRSGESARAGAVLLRNTANSSLRVALAPVGGLTLDALGSGYEPPGTPLTGAATWLRPGAATLVVPAHQTVSTAVVVHVPSDARGGDYLAGISVQQLAAGSQSSPHAGVSIASVSRYAIGVEVSVPGRRRPLIRFTGATIARDPGGTVFALLAENSGNVILTGVQGRLRISQGDRVVVSRQIAPGTFISGSRIAYPVDDTGLVPSQGARFRVQAVLRYGGRLAQLDTSVAYGRHQATLQRLYRHAAPSPTGSTDWLQIALFASVALYSVLVTIVLVRRRRNDGAAAAQ